MKLNLAKLLILGSIITMTQGCVYNVRVGSVFNITSTITDRDYGTSKFEAKLCTDVIYTISGEGRNSYKENVCEKGHVIDNKITFNFPLNLKVEKGSSVDISSFGNTKVEILSGADNKDIFLARNVNIQSESAFKYNVTLDLVYNKSVEVNAEYEQFEKCYNKLNKTMSSDFAYQRCQKLIYSYSF